MVRWPAYWPGHDGEDDDFAAFINGVRKHVASRTLTPEQVTWSNASLIEGDLLEHVRALTLIIHPAIAGTGRASGGSGVEHVTLSPRTLVKAG